MRVGIAKIMMEFGFVWLLWGCRPRAIGWWLSRAALREAESRVAPALPPAIE